MRVELALYVMMLSGCRVGVHTFQARTSGTQELEYQRSGDPPSPTKRTGTADMSQRLRGLDMAGLVLKKPFALELGYTLGFSAPHVGETTGDIPPTVRKTGESSWDPRDLSVYDALFVGVGIPLTTVDDLRIGAYGKLSATAIARGLRLGGGPNVLFDGGFEVILPFGDDTSIYLRAGYQIERAELRYPVPYNPAIPETGGDLVGTTTFSGLAAGIGIYWKGPGRD